MNYAHSELCSALGIADRTLYSHRAKLESLYGIELTTGSKRSLRYKDEYLGLIQASVNGSELPETLEGYEFPVFVPVELEPVEPVSALVLYEPVKETQQTKELALYGDPGEVIDLEYTLASYDLSRVEKRAEQNWEASKALSTAIGKSVLHETAEDAKALKAQMIAIYSQAMAEAKAEVLREIQGN